MLHSQHTRHNKGRSKLGKTNEGKNILSAQARQASKDCNCTIVGSQNNLLVANLAFEFKDPEALVSDDQTEMVDRSKHLSGKSGTFIKEGPWSRPLSKAIAAQNNAINSSSSVGVNNIRLAKANAGVTALTFLAKIAGYFIKEDQIAYFSHQVNSSSGVISFLQNAINNNQIPNNFLNSDYLTSIANYLLKGEVAYIYTKNHLGDQVKKENTGLMKVAKGLEADIKNQDTKRKASIQMGNAERLKRAQTDNTGKVNSIVID